MQQIINILFAQKYWTESVLFTCQRDTKTMRIARLYQSVENVGVAYVKGANERNKFFEKINDR